MSYDSQNAMFEEENEQSYMGNMEEDEPSDDSEQN